MTTQNILITGGAGFIGKHLLELLIPKYPHYFFVNIDKLTYSSDYNYIRKFENYNNYKYYNIDINRYFEMYSLINKYKINTIIHLAAETHVDRSIENPQLFIQTNINGTLCLLEAAQKNWEKIDKKIFYYISTDEVYGSLMPGHFCDETTQHLPGNPYAASKSGAEGLVRAYANTFSLPFLISNSSNNYGPNQLPDKLIPLIIRQLLMGDPVFLHGDGLHQRDWLWVFDHCRAIDFLLHKGIENESYCIGGKSVYSNIETVKLICSIMANKINVKKEKLIDKIKFIEGRQGNDRRYAVNIEKMQQLGWSPSVTFQEGLEKTVSFYLETV